MTLQEFVQKILIKVARIDFRRITLPPVRLDGILMKSDAAELPRIGEDECAFALIKHEVVMLPGSEIRIFDPNFTGHAEMKAEPAIVGKSKQHAFTPPGRAFQLRTDKMFAKRTRVRPAKHPVLRVKLNAGDSVVPTAVPLFTVPFDLG